MSTSEREETARAGREEGARAEGNPDSMEQLGLGRTTTNFEKLKGRENFDEWKISAKSSLIIKDLWKVIEKPWTPEESPKSNARAVSEITLMVDPTLYSYIKETKSAREVWDGIARAFDDSGTARKITILNQLVSVKLVKVGNMEKYINEILLLWHKTKIAGFNLEEQVIASLMLGGLPDEFRAMILGIENAGKELTVDYVKTVLLQGIKDPMLKESYNDREKAMAAKHSTKFKRGTEKRKCFTCGSIYHLSFDCNKKKKRKCYNCGKTSHLAKECRLPRKKPEEGENQGESSKQHNKDKERVMVAFFNNESTENEMKNNWYVDSGASSHMTNRKDLLQNLRTVDRKEILVANKEKLEVNLIGDVKLYLKLNDETVICTIKNVLYVPKLCTSLLSVTQLNKQGYSVLFEQGECHITNSNGELMAIANLKESMYKLMINTEEFVFVTSEQERAENAIIWHRRLGHIGFGKIKFLMLVPSARI